MNEKNNVVMPIYNRCEICGKWLTTSDSFSSGMSEKYFYKIRRNGKWVKVWQNRAWCSEEHMNADYNNHERNAKRVEENRKKRRGKVN